MLELDFVVISLFSFLSLCSISANVLFLDAYKPHCELRIVNLAKRLILVAFPLRFSRFFTHNSSIYSRRNRKNFNFFCFCFASPLSSFVNLTFACFLWLPLSSVRHTHATKKKTAKFLQLSVFRHHFCVAKTTTQWNWEIQIKFL